MSPSPIRATCHLRSRSSFRVPFRMLGPQTGILKTTLLEVLTGAPWSLPHTRPPTKCGRLVFCLLREFNLSRRYVLVTIGHFIYIIRIMDRSNQLLCVVLASFRPGKRLHCLESWTTEVTPCWISSKLHLPFFYRLLPALTSAHCKWIRITPIFRPFP